MEFTYQSPGFTAEGTEPPSSLKTSGWQAGQKPPAAYFSWFWTRVSKCITELQEMGVSLDEAIKAVNAATLGYDNTSSGLEAENVQAALDELVAGIASKTSGIPIVTAASTDGITYTATVEGVTELTVGMQITIIPNKLSQSTAPTLNVNGLGAKGLRALTGYNTAACVQGAFIGWIAPSRPITVKYNGLYWIVTDVQRTSAGALYGDVIKRATKTISTAWTENEETGVKTLTVSYSDLTGDANEVANVDVYYNGDGTAESYETFVEQQNQFLEYVTNGYAETVSGGIKFTIFGDAPTVSIPIIIEVF